MYMIRLPLCQTSCPLRTVHFMSWYDSDKKMSPLSYAKKNCVFQICQPAADWMEGICEPLNITTGVYHINKEQSSQTLPRHKRSPGPTVGTIILMYGSIRRARHWDAWKLNKVWKFSFCCHGNPKCGLWRAIWPRRSDFMPRKPHRLSPILTHKFSRNLDILKYAWVSMEIVNNWLSAVDKYGV